MPPKGAACPTTLQRPHPRLSRLSQASQRAFRHAPLRQAQMSGRAQISSTCMARHNNGSDYNGLDAAHITFTS
jgi:hypothetical protein